MPIEQLASEFERIVASGQDIEELASGFGSDMGPAEGPVWWKEGAISCSVTSAIITA